MKLNEGPKVNFEERIAIHDQKFGSLPQVGLGKLDGARGAKRLELFRVTDLEIESAAIAEFIFDLIGKIASAKD